MKLVLCFMRHFLKAGGPYSWPEYILKCLAERGEPTPALKYWDLGCSPVTHSSISYKALTIADRPGNAFASDVSHV